MFTAPAMIIGAIYGWMKAGKMGGNRMDKAQYAAAHGLAFFLVALVITIIADLKGWV